MRIAVPVHEGSVSPVLDWARTIALVTHDEGNGAVGERRDVDLIGVAPALRAGRLAELGADVLVCGGVSEPLARDLESRGVVVMPGVVGPVEEVVEAYVRGSLDQPRFAMPGWRCLGRCGRGRMRRGRGRPGRRGGRR